MSTEKTYNGWTNYETWAANLWLDNDQGTQEYWQERAEEAYRAAVEADPDEGRTYWTGAAAEVLGALLKDELDDEAELPRQLDGTMYADLLNAALSEVNWYEIAEAKVEALDRDAIEAEVKGEPEGAAE